jgi:hypothetical protein
MIKDLADRQSDEFALSIITGCQPNQKDHEKANNTAP